MCLQSLQLLESPSSLLAHSLPSLCSVNSVNSHTIGIMSRTSNTTDVISRRMRSNISAIGMVSTTEPVVTKMKPSDQRQFRISVAMLGKFKIPNLVSLRRNWTTTAKESLGLSGMLILIGILRITSFIKNLKLSLHKIKF